MKTVIVFLLSLTTVLSSKDLSNVNIVVPYDLNEICEELQTRNASQECRDQVAVVCDNPAVLFAMADATSKVYPGLAYATPIDPGNYDQCMSIDHTQNGTRVIGQFCFAGLLIPTPFPSFDGTQNLIIALSICVPDACSSADLLGLMNITLPLVNDEYCSTKETGLDWSAGDIIVACIFLLVAAVMILSTIYDFYLKKRQLKSPHPLLLAFSMLSNGRKLLQTSKGTGEQIMSFHGIKFISMMWILAGHNFLVWTSIPISNYREYHDAATTKRYMQYITAAYLAVDTFFFLSGFLLAYHYMKQENRTLKNHVFKIPYLYFHRILRILPAILMIYLYAISIGIHLGQGPLYHRFHKDSRERCLNNWWQYFLFIQNYLNFDSDICLIQTWYLNADMHLFLISPLILIPAALQIKKRFKSVMVQLAVLNVLFTVVPITMRLVFPEYDNQYETHARLIDYYLGAMLGIYMREAINKPFKISPVLNLIIWIIVLSGMMALVVGFHEIYMNGDQTATSIFNGLSRPAWCIGLCWIVYSSHHGYGGIVNWILTRPIMQIGSKLTYSLYLLHPSVLIFYYGINLRTRQYFNDLGVFYTWCGHLIFTLLISVFWTLAFESPILVIEKSIFGAPRKPQPRDANGVHKPEAP